MRTGPEWTAALVFIAACVDSSALTDTKGSTGATDGPSSSSTSTGTTATTEAPTSTGTTSAPECAPGEVVCASATAQVLCGPDGRFDAEVACPDGGTCIDGAGCVDCLPGAVQCAGDDLQQCGDAGAWEVVATCSAAQGLSCDAASMKCLGGACLPEALGLTATGCEFYAVTAVQLPENVGPFAIVIENPGVEDANITITRDERFAPSLETAPAGTATVLVLPWVHDLWNVNTGHLVRDGAYRVQSDRPVRVFQYSPVVPSYSAGSSLLWPRHTWGTSYFAASYDSVPIKLGLAHRSAWAVVSGGDGNSVVVTPRPGTKAKGGPGIGADGGGEAPLDAGDVLQIVSADEGDLTGAWFTADKPIQVLGGHECAQVPGGFEYCDHLEEMMLPASQLGTEYVLVPPVQSDPIARHPHVVRIIATEADTTLTYEPPQMGAPSLIAGVGDFVELPPSDEIITLMTDKPVLVAQYTVGATFDVDYVDPAMLATLPVSRWHTTHYVHALADWLPVDLDILAPTGADVSIEGAPVTGFVAVGNSPYQVAHVRVYDDPGLAKIVSDQPIAVNVYARTPNIYPQASFWHSTGGSLAP